MEAVLGVTAMDANIAAVTVNVAEPLIVPEAAVIVVVPSATVVAKPLVLIVAIDVAEEVQVAVFVRFWVVPLLYVPVALYCCVLPAATEAVEGATEIEVKTAAVTVSVAVPLILLNVAVIVDVPALTPLAAPV
jgi:hypothetical protein